MRSVNCVPFQALIIALYLFPLLPFLFSTLQGIAQERTAHASARGMTAAVRSPEPRLLNLLLQSYLNVLFPLFLFMGVLAHLSNLLRVWDALCQLRSFTSADECFVICSLPIPFSFSPLFRVLHRKELRQQVRGD